MKTQKRNFIPFLCNGLFVFALVSLLASCSTSSHVEGEAARGVTGEGLLVGNPASLASQAMFDYDSDDVVKDDEISVTVDGASVVRTKLEFAFTEDATVGEINALLQSINGKITSMLEGVNLIIIRIPDPMGLDELDTVIIQTEADPNVIHVYKVYMPEADEVPDNYASSTSDLSYIDHHLAVHAHAAWNARAALENTWVEPPLLIVTDVFGDGPPNSDFNVNVTASDFASGYPIHHGYHILGIISGAYGGDSSNRGLVTGIYPDTLDLRVVDGKNGIDLDTLENKLIQLIKNSSKNVVVNTSLSGTCTTRECAEWLARRWMKKVRGEELYEKGTTGPASLEEKFIHVVSAGNIKSDGATEAEFNSGWNAARLLPNLMTENGVLLEYLTNTLVVENRFNSLEKPFDADCLYPESKYPGDISAVGTDVWSFTGSSTGVNGGAADGTGTSMAAPQVAGIAAYLWALAPGNTPNDIVTFLHVTARDYFLCLSDVTPMPVVDAYSALLVMDDTTALDGDGLGIAPVRLAILDIVGDHASELGGNGVFDEIDVERFLDEVTYETEEVDYSRYDLNGDGYTGGDHATKFNLDIDYFPTYGNVTQEIMGTTVSFNENMVTDLKMLCYYAYSPLYTGDEYNRDTLMAPYLNKCKESKIAFARTPSDTWILNIYEMDDDGSNQTAITNWSNDSTDLEGLAWSPDGAQLAYSATVQSGNYYYFDIFSMNADGTDQVQLTQTTTIDEVHPAWSPDGSQIAFTNYNEVYVMSSLGSGRIVIPHNGGYTGYTPEHPTWSPDGTKLAFADWKDGSSANIFVYDFTTGLNSDLGYGWSPAWSPDGNKIAFTAGSNLHELHVMNPDGSGKTKLYGFPNEFDQIIRSITWSSGSQKIAFDVYDYSQFDIHVINVDGTNHQNITQTTDINEQSPAWLP